MRTIAVLQRFLGFKYAGISFEATSPLPISIPIPTLAGRRQSIVFPTDNVKFHARQDSDGTSVLSTCGIEEKSGERPKWSLADGVMEE